MEELIEAFTVSQVTHQPNSTYTDHPRFALYKSKPSAASQEERRKKFLQAQKLKRYDYASHARGLATNVWEKERSDQECEDDEMECDEYIRKPQRSYKNQLMLSEWLVEVPYDIESRWYLVLCPVGKRCLVVSSRGITKVYAKNGYMINSFPSKLPGGNRILSDGPLHVYCLLDCVYSETEKTFYVLDIMCWNSHPCFDSETEFRFYWKDYKLGECPDSKVLSKDNQYKFVPLPHFNCEKQTIRKVLSSPLPFASKLDGLLFYHKNAHYVSGVVPLVGWLKAYMVPEILGVEVPDIFLLEKPQSYVSMQQHLPEAFKKNEERKKEEEKHMQYEDA